MNITDLLPYLLITFSIWLLILTLLFIKLFTHYNSFTKDTKKKDLLNTLNELLKQSRSNEQNIENTNKKLDQEINKAKKHFKLIGFKRFNPFTDTGGNQSFVLALLDENHDGFVISSLHSRENTRLYAKRIIKGKTPDQILSKEEQQVINDATK